MDKKNIILELSCELIEKIDRLNNTSDRSSFISKLIEEQLKQSLTNTANEPPQYITKMSDKENIIKYPSEIRLVNSKGISVGKFDINTLDGFENMIKKVHEISEDPAVQIRARTLF